MVGWCKQLDMVALVLTTSHGWLVVDLNNGTWMAGVNNVTWMAGVKIGLLGVNNYGNDLWMVYISA